MNPIKNTRVVVIDNNLGRRMPKIVSSFPSKQESWLAIIKKIQLYPGFQFSLDEHNKERKSMSLPQIGPHDLIYKITTSSSNTFSFSPEEILDVVPTPNNIDY